MHRILAHFAFLKSISFASSPLIGHMTRFAKPFAIAAAVVGAYFCTDATLIHPPITTLGSRRGIELEYQQMLAAHAATSAVASAASEVSDP